MFTTIHSVFNLIRACARRGHRAALIPTLVLATVAAVSGTVAAAWPNLPNTPLAVQNISDPNLLLTLDDSGSMSWAYAPDNIGTTANQVYFLSSRFNSMAYNPFDQYDPPYDPVLLNGTRLATTFNQAWHNGFHIARGSVSLLTSYKPVSILDPAGAGAPTFAVGPVGALFTLQPAFIYAFYNDLSPTDALPAPGTDKTTFVRRTAIPASCGGLTATTTAACYIKVVIPAAHQQNFANWYSFYKTRNLTVASSANIAFFDLNPKYRVSWQTLTSCKDFDTGVCKGWDATAAAIPNKLRPLDDVAHRANLYKYLARLPAANSTPLRSAVQRAGNFIYGGLGGRGTGIDSPRANVLGVSETGPNSAPISACRANYHVLLTDGIWNGAETINGVGNVDNTALAAGPPPAGLPDERGYTPIAPYKDANANSIADMAFQQWATDAQSSLLNNVVPYYPVKSDPPNPTADYWNPRNDPATWQHMNTFAIGLGLNGFLTGTNDTSTHNAGYLPRWAGSTFAGDFDLMSAGTAWPKTEDDSPGNVADLWHAAINGRGEFFGADSPSAIRDAFRSILSRISNRSTSSGQIATSSRRVGAGSLAFDVTYKPGDWYSTISAKAVYSDGSSGSTQWTTDTTFTSDSPSRSIFTWDASAGSGRSFAWSLFTVAEKASFFGTTALPAGDPDLLSFLRGDRSKETSKFRVRKQLLGDVVSSELIASAKTDQGFSFLPAAAGGSTYLAFVDRKKPVVFVGANDGMLHAFGSTGAELFAYVPYAVLPKLKELAKPPLIHQPLVDGPLSLGDAYLGGAWKTLVVGGLGGGGRAVFGLDVTNLTQAGGSGAFTGSNVLFEVNDVDMGYSFAKPVIGRTANGDWVAVWGNGYGGATAQAILYVYNLTTKNLTKINTLVGGVALGNENGLSSPVGLEFTAGNIVGVYAGDYQGNMWKFTVNNTGAFVLANGSTPFFRAADGSSVKQPITAAPELAQHPAGGVMVTFGTGKFFESQDRSTRGVNTFYAVRDRGLTTALTRSSLVQQTITAGSSVSAANRAVSTNTVDYTAKAGWYLDFDTTIVVGPNGAVGPSGERIIARPIQLSDTIAFATYTPGANACEGTGLGYLMFVNTFTGGLLSPELDINGDGVVNSADRPASGNNYAGVRIDGDGTLLSPVASLVGIQPRGVRLPPAPGQGCGTLGQTPCDGVTADPVTHTTPAKGCIAGLIVKNNLCSNVTCPSGSIVVQAGGTSQCKVSPDTKYPRWMELKWK